MGENHFRDCSGIDLVERKVVQQPSSGGLVFIARPVVDQDQVITDAQQCMICPGLNRPGFTGG